MMVTSTVTLAQGETLLLALAVDAFEEKHPGPDWEPARTKLRALLTRINDSETVESRHIPARRSPAPSD